MTYSTFALEQDTTLLLTSPSDHGFSQEWGLSIVDILSKGDLAESESVKPFTHKRILAVYNSLMSWISFKVPHNPKYHPSVEYRVLPYTDSQH